MFVNQDWRFYRFAPTAKPDHLIYNVRLPVKDRRDDKPADSKPTKAQAVEPADTVLKPWILPTANDFIKYTDKRHVRPVGCIYRNVWLTAAHPVHIGQWGTCLTTSTVTKSAATVNLQVTVKSASRFDALATAVIQIFDPDPNGEISSGPVAGFPPLKAQIKKGAATTVKSSTLIKRLGRDRCGYQCI